MRPAIVSLLTIIIGLMVRASASQELVVDTVITDYTNDSKPKVLARTHVVTESGSRIITQGGRYEYVVTATLRNNGTVDLWQVVSRRSWHPRMFRKRTTFGPSTANIRLGSPYGMCVGNESFSTKVSLLK